MHILSMLQHILKYRTNCEITTLYAGFDGMLLYMCRKLTVEKLNYALVGLLICWYVMQWNPCLGTRLVEHRYSEPL